MEDITRSRDLLPKFYMGCPGFKLTVETKYREEISCGF